MKQKRQEDQRCKSMKKCSKRAPEIKKNRENWSPGVEKIEKNGNQGCLQEVTKREVGKIGVVSNSLAPFLLNFDENVSQDGGLNL